MAMFTNFLGGPYAAHASAAASHSQAPDRYGLLPHCNAFEGKALYLCRVLATTWERFPPYHAAVDGEARKRAWHCLYI